MMDENKSSEAVIRTIAMPADTNPAGDIFGGWLMAQMDLAAGNMAARVARGRTATVAVEAMSFLRPVRWETRYPCTPGFFRQVGPRCEFCGGLAS